MSDVSVERSGPAPIVTWHELQPYVLLAGTLLFVLIYFVGAEEGALSLIGGTSVHEFVHDARHLLGFPCH
jgi:putative cobalt transporter subunit CbtB